MSRRKDRLRRQGKLCKRAEPIARTDDGHGAGHFPDDGVCPDCGEHVTIDGIRPWTAAPPKCHFCGSEMPEAEKAFRCSPLDAPPHGYDPEMRWEDFTCGTCGMEMPVYYDPESNTIVVDAHGIDDLVVRAWKEAQGEVWLDASNRLERVGSLARRLAEKMWDKGSQ